MDGLEPSNNTDTAGTIAHESHESDVWSIWRDLFMSAGVSTEGSWVITNSQAVRRRMNKMDTSKLIRKRSPVVSNQQTDDFSTMYTQLRLDKTTSPPPTYSSTHISDEIKYRMIEKFNAMSKKRAKQDCAMGTPENAKRRLNEATNAPVRQHCF